MKVSEALEGALKVLDNGNGWAKNWFAFDAKGNKVGGGRPEAGEPVKFCAAGALRVAIWGSYKAWEDAVWDNENASLSMKCVDYLGFDYVQLNDHALTEWPAVEARFHEAINKAKAAEAEVVA